jgi:hypothetical protein
MRKGVEMTQQFNDNVQIIGAANTTQLLVKGVSTQTQPLQDWQNSAGSPQARLTGDGRVQVGDFEPDGQMATDDALLELHRGSISTKPKRGLHTLGQMSGVLTEAVTWAMQELRLLGTGGISSLQTALRARLTHSNTGAAGSAQLRAGDFEVVNEGGASGAVGEAVGVKGAVSNTATGKLVNAVALDAALSNSSPGTITNAYGLRVGNINQGTNNFAIQTGAGKVQLGDDLIVSRASAAPSLIIAGPAGTTRGLFFQNAASGAGRWSIFASSTAEAGGNSGSNLLIGRYSDAGAYLGSPIDINRSTGRVTIGPKLLISGSVPAGEFQLQLTGDEAGKLSSNVWSVVSDERVKQDIRPYEEGISLLRRLPRPQRYTYIDTLGGAENREQVGFTAQQLQTVVPHWVRNMRVKLHPEDMEDSEIMGVNSGELIYILMNAVLELAQRVDQLERVA